MQALANLNTGSKQETKGYSQDEEVVKVMPPPPSPISHPPSLETHWLFQHHLIIIPYLHMFSDGREIYALYLISVIARLLLIAISVSLHNARRTNYNAV